MRLSFFLISKPGNQAAASLRSCSEKAKRTLLQQIQDGNLRSSRNQYIIVARNERVITPVNDSLTYNADRPLKLDRERNLAYPAPLSLAFTFLYYVFDMTISTKRSIKLPELMSKLQAAQEITCTYKWPTDRQLISRGIDGKYRPYRMERIELIAAAKTVVQGPTATLIHLPKIFIKTTTLLNC